MNFLKFLQQAQNKSFWADKRVICFKGKNYPSLFFDRLFEFLEKENTLPFCRKNLFLLFEQKFSVTASLQQSFLGEKIFYWLGEYNFGAKEKKKAESLDFLLNYRGPHFIAFYLNDEKLSSAVLSKLKKIEVVEIDAAIDKDLFQRLLKLFNKSVQNGKADLVKRIFQQANSLSLGRSLWLMSYLDLVNPKKAEIFYEYLSAIIIEMQPSLNLLSHYFFLRQAKPFFKIWSRICNDYSQMFWIFFWSEQMWRASHVVKFLKQKNFAGARSMGYRLPFMFIQQGWKNFSLQELADYHQFLYNIDYALKVGSTFCALDLFYFNHFKKRFFEKG